VIGQTAPMRADRIAEIVDGRLRGNPKAVVHAGRVDSRLCRPGDLFVALAGERTDGNLFIESAWNRGATVALADVSKDLPKPPPNRSLVAVVDVLAALQEIARQRRNDFPNLKVVGITGSNGKTTTKEILGSILRHWKEDRVLINEGNLNSEEGLPLTLLSLGADHEIAVLEMGMNRRGEIGLLTEIARPEICLITNIGTAHVGMLGSKDAIAEEKRAILAFSTEDSIAIVGWDEPRADFLLKDFTGKVLRFGRLGTGGWEGLIERGIDGWTFIRNGNEIDFRLPGHHNAMNAMAAVEASVALGAPESSITRGLEAVEAAFGRSEILRGSITVVRDCYNANPESLKAALKMYSRIKTSGRRVLVLGELQELGEETEEALREAARAVAALEPDAIFLFGITLEVLKSTVMQSGFLGSIQLHSDMDELQKSLFTYLIPGDLVLLKGSRGNALERLCPILREVGSESLRAEGMGR